ncbi:MAG: 4-alpha-glucanotransferase [Treponemataceae bacterium]
MNTRSSGILLHPTSLPGTSGIGTIGRYAFDFVDWLEKAGQTLWQILPIGPTGYGDSPYSSFSTFAGNPLLIDLDILKENGWLTEEQCKENEPIKNSTFIDYGAVVDRKIPLLKIGASQFLSDIRKKDVCSKENLTAVKYCKFKKENSFWLENYAVFMAIKDFYNGKPWCTDWQKELATYKSKAVTEFKYKNQDKIEIYKAIQFFFFTQWQNLKEYANKKNIKIIGDIPIFVAQDSSDVWSNQHLFQLHKNGKPKFVAGVPPDYFSADGQLWGNPVYDWNKMKKDGYRWWIERIKAILKLTDYVRIDHFRGFEAYWAVPYGEKNAVNGKWIKGPNSALFKKIKKKLGEIPIIAEDLGLITKEVQKLRDDFNLSGMKILQFAFDLNEEKSGCLKNAFLPHEYGRNFVVYTGTHDNQTMQGYIDCASSEEKSFIKRYLCGNLENIKIDDEQICPLLIREAFASVAKMAVIPLQDIFAVGDEGRMNIPSTQGGHNWQWRMSTDMLFGENAEKKANWLKSLSTLYDRN